MRPEILFPLFAPCGSLPGVGPKLSIALERLAGPRLLDLLRVLPQGQIDRRVRASLAAVAEGEVASITVSIEAHRPPRNKRGPLRILCRSGETAIDLVYFAGAPEVYERMAPVGTQRIVSGRIDRHEGRLQMAHPDYVLPPDKIGDMPQIEPVYPLTEGLTQRHMLKIMRAVLQRAPLLPEWLDAGFQAQNAWPGWRQALINLHQPVAQDSAKTTAARRRLAYDELLASQLALMLVRARMKRAPGRVLDASGVLQTKLRAALPFALTGAQERSLHEIAADLRSGERMLRLLQGDVGAGKTIVAVLTLLAAVECGAQGALMAPTEILAQQHFETASKMLEPLGVRMALLTGREKPKTRAALLEDLSNGQIAILCGTHALFSEDVAFRDLALVVVDEQHKFGVYQRLALAAKAEKPPHVLVMTATPIPRTLALTVYGDMDSSKLDERPPGRHPVDTRVLPLARLGEVEAALQRALDAGGRVYWVCPAIDGESLIPGIELTPAEDRFEALKARFGDVVALAHGRMKPAARDEAMRRFQSGEARILVATTVIEVGVDVPEATVMVIENAERFGLSQLHQLRGRVGRGVKPSVCLLLYTDQDTLTEGGRSRLSVMRATDDGFAIAEEDLRLRGAGEVLGTKQSGLPELHYASLPADTELLQAARDDARLIVQRDASLATPRGAALRSLLYLFDRDEAVAYLKAG